MPLVLSLYLLLWIPIPHIVLEPLLLFLPLIQDSESEGWIFYMVEATNAVQYQRIAWRGNVSRKNQVSSWTPILTHLQRCAPSMHASLFCFLRQG